MMNFLFVVVALFAFIATISAMKSDAELRSEFGQFVSKFNKNYNSAVEFESRYAIFKANMEKVAKLNAKGSRAQFGVTQFSDWSRAERESYLGRLPQDRSKIVGRHALQSEVTQVSSFDLVKQGVVGPVLDQKSCGSCWAHSVSAGISSSAAKAGIEDPFNVSEQQIVDCDKYDSGCNGGDLPSAFQYIKSVGGLNSRTEYPYTAKDGKCKFNATKIHVPVKDFEWVIEPCQYSDCEAVPYENALTNIIKRGVAPSICVYVSDEWFDYTSGVFEEDCTSDYYSLNHCVLMTAYDSVEQSITLRNSWGVSWGDAGYMRIGVTNQKNGQFLNRCGVFDEMTFAIVV